MADSKMAKKSGYEPQAKRQKLMLADADRAQKHLDPIQPDRVLLEKISWCLKNRGGQGILPLHAHDVAEDICENGTSVRRTPHVKLIEMPDGMVESWLETNRKKAKMSPLLADFSAMSHTGPYYATLGGTHYVEAHKLIKEKRRYKNQEKSPPFALQAQDQEGLMIQNSGVRAVVYMKTLWDDMPALLALMREANLDHKVGKTETELDAFGHVDDTINGLTDECATAGGIITFENVMGKLGDMGLGSMPEKDWGYLVSFRLFLPKPFATMLRDCLFHVVNGRVSTEPKTFAEINTLHVKGWPWCKIFLLVQTYCDELLDESTGAHRPFIRRGPQAKMAKKLDRDAIKLLGFESELLADVTKFWQTMMNAYTVDPLPQGFNEGKQLLANATLMKALGRTLWKVAEGINTQKKSDALAGRVQAVVGSNTEKDKVIKAIMKDRLWKIEDRYANHLVAAGCFEGTSGVDKPKPVWPRNKKEETTTTAISHNAPSAVTSVNIKQDGTVDTKMTIADVYASLCLENGGVGQEVGVRTHDVLLGMENVQSIKIVSFNPPDATILVESKRLKAGDTTPISKNVIVDIADLIPLDKKAKKEEKNPLSIGYEPHHPRVARYDIEKHTRAYMASALNTCFNQLSCASVANVEEKVEVVYIPAKGDEKGLGIYQCRVIENVAVGTLRLYPYGGTLLSLKDAVERRAIEAKIHVKPCYMKCVLVSGKVSKDHRAQVDDFVLYTAMSNNLATCSPDDKIEVKHLAPFWALMLAKKTHQVNMVPYVEDYRCPTPTPKIHGEVRSGSVLYVRFPFFTNNRELKPGELLVVPYDGGVKNIYYEDFPEASGEASFQD